jgi:hypothetical protein
LYELDLDLRVARSGNLVDDAQPVDGHALGVVHRDALREAVCRALLVEAGLRELLADGRVGDADGGVQTAASK